MGLRWVPSLFPRVKHIVYVFIYYANSSIATVSNIQIVSQSDSSVFFLEARGSIFSLLSIILDILRSQF